MIKTGLTIFFLLSIFTSFSQTENEVKIKARKMNYNDFVSQYSINDTSALIIELFFSKKSEAAYGQMSFLPITAALFAIPPTRVIGAGLTIIALPLFVNGALTLYKYRKKKLLDVLVHYKATGELPGWIKRKTLRLMDYQSQIEYDY